MPVEATTEPVVVKVNSGLKKLYLAAMAALHVVRADTAAAWHRRYLIAADIIEHTPPLFLAGSYATEAAFFGSGLEESPQAVYRNIRVSKLATPAEITRYSATRLSLVIAYLEAVNKEPIRGPGSVQFAKVRIQLKNGSKTVSKAIDEISYSELRGAIAQLNPSEKSKRPAPMATEVASAVKRSGVKGVKVTVTKTRISLRAPLSSLNAIARELAELDVASG